YASENIGHAVIVVLRPFFQRMIVAASAADTDSKKTLAHVLRDFFGLQCGAEIVGWSVQECVAGRGQHLRTKLVPRLVRPDAFVKVAVERPHALVFKGPAIYAKEIAPLVRPKIDELGPRHQGLDQVRAFVLASVGAKGLNFLRSRKRSQEIDI